MVPRNMKGEFLYPLNKMKKIYPEIYKEDIGRERIMQIKIPYLNCKWNDCIHLTSVNPKKIVKALMEAGSPPIKDMKWFKINPSILEGKKLIEYIYLEDVKKRNSPEGFKRYENKDLKEYSKMPKGTKIYYKNKFESKEKPLLFHLIPHILYKDKIPINKMEIINL